MKLQTKYHGIREYEENEVITFQKGIPGFETLKEFIFFPVEENEVFNILHAIEDESVGLVVISPFNVLKDYEIEIDEDLTNRLKLKKPEDVLVLNTVTVSSQIDKITTNLRAPIIINIKEKLGEQIILNNDKYSVKQPLFKEDV
ncbi:flagellar assembly factor FliW [Clostridium homopropionicum DSM 5847]|uniref:Flagellar assembly factor FliW n=1 Tax=Clostridium homopropionicum DSM 5847 TaxID=1121318 RepID=A0A0L6ZE07_9CLOT|nr:flagellar assembly protein FliW [Clostridium homopropionicum]KOA21048.1 flagellar assembly factor FliW [Clostridium homopropionicum DSM 5847]SFF98550.1 flagellar assembly factor FliW [Clostridium homopropionicum]